MQSFCGSIRLMRRHAVNSSKTLDCKSIEKVLPCRRFLYTECNPSIRNGVEDVKFGWSSIDCSKGVYCQTLPKSTSHSPLALKKPSIKSAFSLPSNNGGTHSALPYMGHVTGLFRQSKVLHILSSRCISTVNNADNSSSQDDSATRSGVAPRIKFKRLDKTARNIMKILDEEAVVEVKKQREIPDIKPGYIIQLKVEVPENRRRVSILKGIVIARRNAGFNTTFRLRRLVAGVGVESLFPLYSPNIKEIKVLDKKKVRRAKLYYLRDRMNPLKK